MIELIIAGRCTGCNACVDVCPTGVFDPGPSGRPLIARVEACQTCFMCELYCTVDALYVAPDCESRVAVDEAVLVASGLLGQYRRDSGWHEWADEPSKSNEHWRMEGVFARARG
jgi:NAD-dependent dihydropyrimidine dehydrogenase PreA subunit